MTFLTAGLAIAGLCAIAIPILIHLLARQRRRPIEWAAMRFLLEAFRKHRRRLQLEQILLLAVRCLVVALLGLALARPILERAGVLAAGASRDVYIVIDDGMASGLTDQEGNSALDQHVAQATDLVNSLGAGDTIGLITAARPAKPVLAPPSTNHAAVVNLLQSLSPRQSPTDLAGAMSLVRSAVEQSRRSGRQTLVYLFSEFRHGSASLDSPLPSTSIDQAVGGGGGVRLLASQPASEPASNVQIVSIEPVRSMILQRANDGSGQVTVRLRRSGGSAGAIGAEVTRVRLSADDLPAIEPKIVRWAPGQTEAEAEFMLIFRSSADRQVALTATIDDDALNADNQRHAVVELRNRIRVLLVNRRSFGFERSVEQWTAGQWIRRALEPFEASPIQVVESEPAALDVADVRATDVVILPRPDLLSDRGWEILREFVQRDGLLVVMPPAEVRVHQWSEHLSTTLGLPLRLALEVVEHEDGLPLAESQPNAEILRLISSDLGELAGPVLAYRVLPVEAESSAPAQPLMMFADGKAMAVAVSAAGPGQSQDTASDEASRNGDLASTQAAAGQRGLVIYLAIAPEVSWTNLPSKPLMVPLFHELVRQGLSVIRASQRITVGEQPALARGAAARDLLSPSGQHIALEPPPSGRPRQPLEHAGVYGVLDASGQPIATLAVNVDPAAGSTDVQSAAAVASWLGDSGPWTTFDAGNISASLASDQRTSPIAGIVLMIVLALVITETLLARWFSHAYSEQTSKPQNV